MRARARLRSRIVLYSAAGEAKRRRARRAPPRSPAQYAKIERLEKELKETKKALADTKKQLDALKVILNAIHAKAASSQIRVPLRPPRDIGAELQVRVLSHSSHIERRRC